MLTCKKIFLAFLAAAGLLFAPAARAQSGEEIVSFASEITVQNSGQIAVSERIDYFFPTPRHGIYRDIPIRYENDNGERLYVPVAVTGVARADGTSWPYEIISGRNAIRIKIGDPNATVSGTQSYVISYRAEGALRYFGDHDELYWNVTGHDWTVPIRRTSAVIKLPGEVPAGTIRQKCFTGAAGSTAQECLVGSVGSETHIAASGPLTVVVGWAPGIVAKLEAKKESAALPYALAYGPVLLILCGLVMYWWRRGRDLGGRKTIAVQYDPPDNITPAELGVLVDEKADIKDITSTIVDLAVRGYLKIREVEKKGLIFSSADHEFVKLKDYNDGTLKPHELRIMQTIFAARDTESLSNLKSTYAFEDELSDLKDKLYGETVARGYFPRNPQLTRNATMALGIVACFAVYVWASVVPPMMSPLAPSAFIPAIIIIAAFAIFTPLMPRKTPAGTLAYEHVLGFKDYLATAEKYRLEWHEKENIFEKYLPYAIVLGVVQKWSDAFKDIALKQPDWYEGRSPMAGAFNAVAFTNSLQSLDTAMSRAINAKEPKSTSSGSGFSSGGFSGGGFGGGGGGSW